jgi:hypothetical protein
MITYTLWYFWWNELIYEEDIVYGSILGALFAFLTPFFIVLDILCLPFEIFSLIILKAKNRKDGI